MPAKGVNNSQFIGNSVMLNAINEKDDMFETEFDYNSEEYPKGSKISNHYEVPNMSSMLYEFTNKEQDRVHQSFRVGNYVSLRDIPHNIMAGNVSGFQNSKIEDNLYSVMERKSYIELNGNGGYFSKFDWQPDDFNRFREDLSKRRKEKDVKQKEVHGFAPFLLIPSRQKPHKHESYFQSLQFQPYESIAVGFLSEDDPYEANAFEVLRAKWINDSKMLYGDFKFAQGDNSLGKVNKQNLPDMVGFIKRNLLTDWSDINFIIGSNPEDYIEIRLDNESIDTPKGLHAYMNTLVNTNDLMIKYRLRRVVEYWGLKSDDSQYIYYMLAPHWVRQKKPILYLKQFPQ